MKATPTGTKEHPYVLRVNRNGKVGHYTALSMELNGIVEETGAEYLSLRHTFNGKPYLSLHGSIAEKTSPETRYPIYKVPVTENAFWIQGKALVGLLAEELEIADGIKVADVTLVPMGNTDSDSLMDFEIREWQSTEELTMDATAITVDSVTKKKIGADGEDSEASMNLKLPEQEPKAEDTPDTPGSDIWMRVLYCDNGYVVRDDAGVMMVIHSEGSSNKKIARHLGEEIMCEIDDLEEHLETEKPVYGWEVNVNIQPITTPEGFFKEGGGR